MGNKLFPLLHAGSVMCNDCNQSANSATVITSELSAILFLCGVRDREENERQRSRQKLFFKLIIVVTVANLGSDASLNVFSSRKTHVGVSRYITMRLLWLSR